MFKSKFFHLIKGLVFSIIITTVLLAVFSLLLLITDMDNEYYPLFSSICAIVGCMFGALIFSSMELKNGILSGIILATSYYLILTAVSLFLPLEEIKPVSVVRFIIFLLSGAIGGILGVNRKQKNKF